MVMRMVRVVVMVMVRFELEFWLMLGLLKVSVLLLQSVFVLEYLKGKAHNLMNIPIHYQLVQNNLDVINLE